MEGTELVYKGKAAGTYYTHTGGGANYLCMVEDPEYTNFRSGVQGYSYIYSAEYESYIGTNYVNYNVPCAVCHVPIRVAVLMIPGKITCPPSWTREYYGYLMAEHYSHNHPAMFECVDVYPESIPGSYLNSNGPLFYHVEPVCTTGGLCSPYINYKEVTCVVCTK